ncbi:MAG: hypothetical protein P1Q69_09120, partial [Candidatus Thorarchaeota archaeon]|nr:hypothetical protein [Candidatus Thorarchaeota archaeon]
MSKLSKDISSKSNIANWLFAESEILKHATLGLTIFLTTVLLVSMWDPVVNPTTSNILTPEQTEVVAPSYVPHGNINIIGDDDFNSTADSEGWAG